MLVSRIAHRIIESAINKSSKLIKIKQSIELSDEGVFKVLDIYEQIFNYKFKQAKTSVSKIELYRERVVELIHIRGMSAEIVETINKKLINTKYKLNKFQQRWRREHEL